MSSFQLPQWQKEILQIVSNFLPAPTESYGASSDKTVANFLVALQAALADPLKFQDVPAGLDVVEYVTEILSRNGELPLAVGGVVNDETRKVQIYDGYSFALEFASITDASGYAVRGRTGARRVRRGPSAERGVCGHSLRFSLVPPHLRRAL